MKRIWVTLLAVIFLGSSVSPQEAQKQQGKKQFIYVLKLVPRLLDEKNWTAQDHEIVGRHARRLQRLLKEGKVILAGKTLENSDPSQFGIVILEVKTEQEARQIMEEDNAVKEKIMTAQLFPFKIALIK